MSTYNTPSGTESTTNSSYTSAPKKDNKNIFIALLAAGLLGSLGYIWYSKKEANDKDVKQEQQLLATTTQKDEVQSMYDQALVRLDSITNLNTTLNSEITNKDGTIARLKGDIDALIAQKKRDGKLGDREEASLRSKINQLNNEIVNQSVLLRLQQKKSTARKFYPEPVKFSEKELHILRLICEDKTTEEISETVFLSPRTIETIRQNMKAKAGVKTIAGLVMYCSRNKLIE